MRIHNAAALAAALSITSASAQATVVYDTWTSNVAPNGNYELTIDHDAGADKFNYLLTVSPWNAEALGVFIDLGNRDISGPVTLTNVSPAGKVALHALETTSNECGNGCNLNGLTPPLGGDSEWELVFRLGDNGFDGIQTFSWTTQDFGLDESAFGMVGIRAQQLCGLGTLPGGSCNDSDKVYGFGDRIPSAQVMSEPSPLALAAIGLMAVVAIGRKRIMPGQQR